MMGSRISRVEHNHNSSNSKTLWVVNKMILYLTCQTYTLKEESIPEITNSQHLMPWTLVIPTSNKIPLCPCNRHNHSNSNSKRFNLPHSSSSSSSNSNNNFSNNNNSTWMHSNRCSNHRTLCLQIIYLIPMPCNNLHLCSNLRVIHKEIHHNLSNKISSQCTLRVPWRMTDRLSHLMVDLMISKLPSQLLKITIQTYMVAL